MEKVIRVCDDSECAAADVHASATHEYSIDGQQYAIDCCEKHEIQFLAFLELQKKYAGMGRAIGGATEPKRPRAPRTTPRTDTGDGPAIRAWAAARGIEVAERGRIPEELREQWRRESGQRTQLQAVPGLNPPPPPSLRPMIVSDLHPTGG